MVEGTQKEKRYGTKNPGAHRRPVKKPVLSPSCYSSRNKWTGIPGWSERITSPYIEVRLLSTEIGFDVEQNARYPQICRTPRWLKHLQQNAIEML